jgi:hypothetical protein
MKKIIINNLLRFERTPKPDNLVFEKAYSHGFWNVFKYNAELEQFLIDNQIKYEITEKSLL